MNILRRLSLSRLLLLCGVVVAVGIGATALALALNSGPVPPPKPLAQAIHDALAAPKVDGVSARIQFTNHLLEGASLAGNGGEASQLSKSPLLSGASGRLWIAADGHARLELQAEKGDTQILWDGHTAQMYDASTNTLYRYTPTQHTTQEGGGETTQQHKTPTVGEIEEHIKRAEQHATISGATPTDVAGQPAYTVRVSPRENGGLIAGGELSWDAVHGVPLRAAIYSTDSSAPVIELAATEISYGPVDGSVFEFQPPADAKVQDVSLPGKGGSSSGTATSGASSSGTSTSGTSSSGAADGDSSSGTKPHVSVHGKGLEAIVVAESQVKPGAKTPGGSIVESLPTVDVNGAKAAELRTALGTILTWERAGVRYILAGSVRPSAIESFARGL